MTGSLRRAAEILLGPICLRRRLPAVVGGGTIVANARVGGLKYLFKPAESWDPELLDICRLLVHEGDVVWDVGANVGLFSISAAAKAGPEGQVFAIEADIDAVSLLNATNRLHSVDHANVTVVPVAISSANGFVKFSIAQRARAANAIQGYGSTQMGGVKEVRVLPCFSLDTLLIHFPEPKVLKIDVEGAELEVLKGATRILSEIRPRIYCEVASNTRDEVTAILKSHNYRLWDGAVFDGSFSNESSLAANNTVAIPQEKVRV